MDLTQKPTESLLAERKHLLMIIEEYEEIIQARQNVLDEYESELRARGQIAGPHYENPSFDIYADDEEEYMVRLEDEEDIPGDTRKPLTNPGVTVSREVVPKEDLTATGPDGRVVPVVIEDRGAAARERSQKPDRFIQTSIDSTYPKE